MKPTLVTVEWVRMMARYAAWQNEGHIDAVSRMSEVSLRNQRGAFFGSILGTLNHLLWGDRIWMSRLAGAEKPEGGIPASVDLAPDGETWCRFRSETDGAVSAWAEGLGEEDLSGELSWYSGALGRDMTAERALCVVHMFNHQTHHRGQVHAMMTAAGVSLRDTDLFVLPGL